MTPRRPSLLSRGFVPLLAGLLLALVPVVTGLGAQSPPAPAAPAVPAEPIAPAYTVRLALSAKVFRNSNVNDATAAYRVFLERLARQRGYEVNVESEIYDDPHEYHRALTRTDRPIHLGVVIAWEYLDMDLPATIRPRWIVSEDTEPGRAFMILVRRDRGWTRLADLQGKSLSWLEFSSSSLTRDWLTMLLGEDQLPPVDRFFRSITTSPKASTVVLPVFFGTTDACLVDEPSFRLMGELNPQVARNLVPLAQTPRLADVLVCFRETDWGSEDLKREIADALTNLHEDPDGRQILTLFRISRMLAFEPSFLDTARALKERYHRVTATSSP